MATTSDSRLMSALDGIIKEEVASRLRNLSIDDMVDAILRRPDHQAIYDKLFDQLYGGSVSRMIGARGDTRKIYQDIFGEVIARMDNQSQGQQERHGGTVKNADQQAATNTNPLTQIDVTGAPKPSSNELALGPRPQTSESRQQSLPPGSNSPEADPTAKSGVVALPLKENAGTTDASGKYMHSIRFDTLEPGLDAWIPMFMSKVEFCNIGPRVNETHATPRSRGMADSLYDFIKCLNPAYLSWRAERLARRFPWSIRNLRLENARDLVISLRKAIQYNYELKDIGIAFIAVRCFELYEKDRNEPLPHFSVLDEDSELEAFTNYAKSERDIRKGSAILKKDKIKWRDLMRLGGQLSSLLKDFGGESFLILFPLYNLRSSIAESLVSIHSVQYPWNMVRSLLEHTGLGEFFRSLSGAVGEFLITHIRTRDRPKGDFWELIVPVLEKYCLKGISKTSPRSNHEFSSTLWAPFIFFFRPDGLVHLSAGLSLRPISLLQFTDQTLTEDIIQHLIRQRLPVDWSLLGRSEISQVADKDILLHDFKGIVIPLCISSGWCLFCYVNPKRSKTAHPITFINPTKSEERYLTAANLLTKWIPKDQAWIPNEITAQPAKVIDCQFTHAQDSGIHVILHAEAMAKTGKPEPRPMDKKMCRDFRVRHFVALLNEMQQAAAKADLKNAPKRLQQPDTVKITKAAEENKSEGED